MLRSFFILRLISLPLSRFSERSGMNVTRSKVQRSFKSMNWSWKLPSIVQLSKFNAENIRYMGKFLSFVQEIPLWRIKALDEVHFRSKSIAFAFPPSLPPSLLPSSILFLARSQPNSSEKETSRRTSRRTNCMGKQRPHRRSLLCICPD